MADCNVVCKEAPQIMQGDSWPVEFSVVMNPQQPPISSSEIASVEVSLDCLIKKWPDGGLEYDSNKNKFSFWPSQQETFKLRGENRLQVRVKLKNGVTKGFDLGILKIAASNSKEVL